MEKKFKVFFTNKKRGEEHRSGWCEVEAANEDAAREKVIKEKNLSEKENFTFFFPND